MRDNDGLVCFAVYVDGQRWRRAYTYKAAQRYYDEATARFPTSTIELRPW